MRPIAAFKLLVVPVLAAQKHAEVALAKLEVMHAFQDQRIDVAVLVIKIAVVGSTGRCGTEARRVTRCDQSRLHVFHAPVGAQRYLRVEAALDIAPLKFDGRSRKAQRARCEKQPDGCASNLPVHFGESSVFGPDSPVPATDDPIETPRLDAIWLWIQIFFL